MLLRWVTEFTTGLDLLKKLVSHLDGLLPKSNFSYYRRPKQFREFFLKYLYKCLNSSRLQ